MIRGLFLLVGATALLGSGCEGRSDLVLDASAPADDAGPAPADAGAPDAAPMDAAIDAGECPPVPLCNWCGGEDSYDDQGCVVGFVCANGADPCLTAPCSDTPPTGCEPGEVCGPDMLCWPAPNDAGTQDAGPPADAGLADAAAPDAGPPPDSGLWDAATPDAGPPPDAGPSDGGLPGAPICDLVGTRSEGWYRPDGSRVCWTMCANDVADCLYPGTRSEGWYARGGAGCDGARIEWARCAP